MRPRSPFTVERDLKVKIATKRKGDAKGPIRPGEEIEVTVTTTDPQGKPVAAEVSLAMVEQSLLDRFGWQVRPIQDFFRGDAAAVGRAHHVEHHVRLPSGHAADQPAAAGRGRPAGDRQGGRGEPARGDRGGRAGRGESASPRLRSGELDDAAEPTCELRRRARCAAVEPDAERRSLDATATTSTPAAAAHVAASAQRRSWRQQSRQAGEQPAAARQRRPARRSQSQPWAAGNRSAATAQRSRRPTMGGNNFAQLELRRGDYASRSGHRLTPTVRSCTLGGNSLLRRHDRQRRHAERLGRQRPATRSSSSTATATCGT